MNKITASAVKQVIESAYTTASYGLRVLTHDQLGLGVGDTLPASRNYSEDHATDDSLPGSSTIGVDAACGEVWDEDAERAIRLVSRYSGDVVALVVGEHAGNGEDEGELLISDARIIAVFAK